MNRITNAIFFAGLIVLISSCDDKNITVTPSSTITTELESFSGYSKLDVRTVFEVSVSFSDTEEIIEVEANENLHQYIIFEKTSNTLVIRLQDNVNIKGDVHLKVRISTKMINSYLASGAASIQLIDKLTHSDASIMISGASMARLTVNDNIDVSASGASILYYKGTAIIRNQSVSGGSQVVKQE